MRFGFLPSDKKYFIAKGENYDWTALISGCLYDEVGEIYIQTLKEEEKMGGKSRKEGQVSKKLIAILKRRPLRVTKDEPVKKGKVKARLFDPVYTDTF